MFRSKPLIFLALFFLWGCENERVNIRIEKQEFENGYLYQFMTEDSILLDIGFTGSGDLKYIMNYPAGHDQQLLFSEETGVLLTKYKMDPKTRKKQGRAYFFYKHSGNLSGDFNFVEGVKTGSAVSYHDSTDRIQSIMLYNDDGELYYRKTFDKKGNLLKEEGSKN
jgi:antitoxin component YwqK of YwqJK toxin-antitoxin module